MTGEPTAPAARDACRPRGDGRQSTPDPASRAGATGSASGSSGATRRGYLRGVGALGVAGTPVAAAGLARGAASDYADRFDRVVDVADAGADDTGDEPVTDVLRSHRDDDTLLYFPPGRYYLDEQVRFTGFSNFGLAGEDATLVPADYHRFDGPRYRLFRLGVPYSPGEDLLFEGFTVDQTAPDTGIRAVEAMVTDGLEVRDVDVVGRHDSGTWGPGFFSVTDPGGAGVVERFRAPDGGAWVSETPNAGELWRGPSGVILSRHHRGTLTIRDCELGGFPDNGLYGYTDGVVRVLGGEYANSNVASVRLAGRDCLLRDAVVRVDERPANFDNQRGVRLDAGRARLDGVTVDLARPNGHGVAVHDDVEAARIESSKVYLGDRVDHGIVISPEAGPTDVVDTDVEIHGGGNAIQIHGDDAGPVVCERVQVWGQASGRSWRHAIRCTRDDCEFRRVKVWQPGPDLRRALVLNGDGCLVYDCTFKSRHHPVVVNGRAAWLEADYLESYDGYEAVRLNDWSADVTIKECTLVEGVLDDGSAGLSTYGNSWV